MIAVILAAGRGTRLRPLTDAIPKALVPFRGKPILAHAVEALRRGGVTDVAVVTGYRADRIAALAPELGVVMRHNSRFASTNMVASLFCAEDLMQDDDLLVVYGDIVFRPAIVAALREDDAPFAVAVNVRWRELWALRMRDPLADAETLKLDAAGHIVEIGKTPRSYDEVQGQYMGLIRIGRDALPAVRAFYHSLDRGGTYDGQRFDGMFMTSFVQAVADRLMKVKAIPADGGWAEIDAPADLDAYRALPDDFFA